MARTKKHYTDEFKTTLVELYKSGKSLADISRKYSIAKPAVTVWINVSFFMKDQGRPLEISISRL